MKCSECEFIEGSITFNPTCKFFGKQWLLSDRSLYEEHKCSYVNDDGTLSKDAKKIIMEEKLK